MLGKHGSSELHPRPKCACFSYKFSLGYIHYMGGLVVTIPIRLILYISYIARCISPQPLPTPPKAIATGFLVLFHIGI
jgi:hypothetical protein